MSKYDKNLSVIESQYITPPPSIDRAKHIKTWLCNVYLGHRTANGGADMGDFLVIDVPQLTCCDMLRCAMYVNSAYEIKLECIIPKGRTTRVAPVLFASVTTNKYNNMDVYIGHADLLRGYLGGDVTYDVETNPISSTALKNYALTDVEFWDILVDRFEQTN